MKALDTYVEFGVWYTLGVDKEVLCCKYDAALCKEENQALKNQDQDRNTLFSWMPVYFVFHVHPGPLVRGMSFRISIDCVA